MLHLYLISLQSEFSCVLFSYSGGLFHPSLSLFWGLKHAHTWNVFASSKSTWTNSKARHDLTGCLYTYVSSSVKNPTFCWTRTYPLASWVLAWLLWALQSSFCIRLTSSCTLSRASVDVKIDMFPAFECKLNQSKHSEKSHSLRELSLAPQITLSSYFWLRNNCGRVSPFQVSSMVMDCWPHNFELVYGHSVLKQGPARTPGQMHAAAVCPSEHTALQEQDRGLGEVPHLQLFPSG